jgi:DNA modification methylase
MLLLGDCLDVLSHWPDNTFDAVCTDPPYGLTSGPTKTLSKDGGAGGGFMGKTWDHGVPGVEYWREVLRVAKPGAFLTAFGGARTHHRLMSAIEDAGWEIRDCSMLFWLFGTGMPKGLDVSKALDKMAGAERQIVGMKGRSGGGRTCMNDAPGHGRKRDYLAGEYMATAPATELAKLYDGYNVAIKPSYEPIVVARKPLVGTVAQNVERYGTGGLNIDATRVPTDDNLNGGAYSDGGRAALPGDTRDAVAAGMFGEGGGRLPGQYKAPTGRWPPNVLLQHAADCTEEACGESCPCRELNGQSGNIKSPKKNTPRDTKAFWFNNSATTVTKSEYGDEGGASRFFPRFHYSSKTSRKERAGSSHPTIKPLAVVEWLLRLTSPPASTNPRVLDPFCGSGTLLIAAKRLGIRAVGIEKEAEYVEQAYRRVTAL